MLDFRETKGVHDSMNNIPNNIDINKEPARTWFLPYSCRCNALSGARILNGHTPESAYAGIISEKSNIVSVILYMFFTTLLSSKTFKYLLYPKNLSGSFLM